MPMPKRYDRVERFRADEATARKIDECYQAEVGKGQGDASRSGAIRNAIDLYHEWIVRGYTIYAEDDARGGSPALPAIDR